MNEDACETKYNSFTKKAQNESEACGTGLELMTGEKVARKGKKFPHFPRSSPGELLILMGPSLPWIFGFGV